MSVRCPEFSYTKPRRLPKKRTRPLQAAFRAAEAHLNFINRKAGKFLVPAIEGLLSDEEISPEEEYRMVHHAAQKAMGTEGDSTMKDHIEHEKMRKGKATSKTFSRQRRVVIDSDDEENTPSVLSSPRSEKIGKRRRSLSPPAGNTKQHRDRFLSSTDGNDDRKIRKFKKPRQDLYAELDDLDIDMEGWTASEDSPRKLRRREKMCVITSSTLGRSSRR